ncbi:MAG: hypothetical protein ABIR34_13160, partial [Marmoricola sp.]
MPGAVGCRSGAVDLLIRDWKRTLLEVARQEVAHLGTVCNMVSGGHPRIGSRVSLLDEPRFEGRNLIIETDGREPIDPIHLQISRAGFRLRGKDLIED